MTGLKSLGKVAGVSFRPNCVTNKKKRLSLSLTDKYFNSTVDKSLESLRERFAPVLHVTERLKKISCKLMLKRVKTV